MTTTYDDNKKGYHTINIAKGTYGTYSKIHEEFHEFADAVLQENKILALVELTDLIGSIIGYLDKEYNSHINIQDLVKMAELTNSTFESGYRKPR